MMYITYRDLLLRYGKGEANVMVRTIETLAKIQNEIITPFDQEVRLQRALEALNNVNIRE